MSEKCISGILKQKVNKGNKVQSTKSKDKTDYLETNGLKI
jgi:hypothetical protein